MARAAVSKTAGWGFDSLLACHPYLFGWRYAGTQEKPILDKVKLLLAMVPLAAGIGAYYYFGDQPAWIRVIGLLVAGGVSVMIALQTELGRVAWAFRREAIIEVRKVVWPTRKETTQTTLVVLVVVILMAILLWLLDMFLAWAVRFLTG